MTVSKTTFVLFFGNRGLFPASLISGARQELPNLLQHWGHATLMLDENATRYGAVETSREGEVFANFLHHNRGKYGGVILCLPNFGDETGAVAALKEAGVPILIQAYPDELDKMKPELRRDAFCGKLSIMDVFHQYGVPFTALKPHVINPDSDKFKTHIDYFDRVCRVVNGVHGMVVGAIGARTTPFKTVRIDEVTLQRFGITVETIDLSHVFARMNKVSPEETAYKDKAYSLKKIASWHGVPEKALENLVRLGVVLDELVTENRFAALAIRCWTELQSQFGISPCVVMGELNQRGISSACEVDVGNAVAMHALHLASGQPSACLDWNNNYGDDEDKCILFHCGPVPPGMMKDLGQISDHPILANVVGEGCSYGCNVGRIAASSITFGSLLTEDGFPQIYLGEGNFTNDQVPADFFGCAGVAQIDNLQDLLVNIGKAGHRHHVSVTLGHVQEPLHEALENYLGFDVSLPQSG